MRFGLMRGPVQSRHAAQFRCVRARTVPDAVAEQFVREQSACRAQLLAHGVGGLRPVLSRGVSMRVGDGGQFDTD